MLVINHLIDVAHGLRTDTDAPASTGAGKALEHRRDALDGRKWMFMIIYISRDFSIVACLEEENSGLVEGKFF